MTKEEARLTLQENFGYLSEEHPRIVEALKVALEALSQPSLPSDVDEAVEKYANKEFPDEPSCGQWGTGDYEPPVDMEYPREIAKDSFQARVEWLAGQYKFIKAHCVESSNPVSESSDQRLHLITLLYEEDKDTPYVIGGDDIEICICKNNPVKA